MPAKYPKITVITPSYNQGGYIEETIRSVVDQQYPALEYLVFDGGSTDNTVDILKQYSHALAHWESKKDNGQSHAINKGLRAATGDLVIWLNSDDYYTSGSLFAVADAQARYPDANCLIGYINYFSDAGKTHRSENPVLGTVEKTGGYGKMPQPAMFFSGDAYATVGLLNEDLRYCMDLEWWLRYLMVYDIASIGMIDQVLVNFRIHAASKTGSQQAGFAAERDSIYQSIAAQFGFRSEAQLIASWGNSRPEYVFGIPAALRLPAEKVRAMIHYFILLRGEEFYVQHNRAAARECFGVVASSLLSGSDAAHLRKLRFRNTMVPLSVIKLLRRSN